MVYLIGFTDTHQYYGLFNWFARDCYNVTFKIQIKKILHFLKGINSSGNFKRILSQVATSQPFNFPSLS